MTRKAKFGDIPEISALMEKSAATSKYAGRATYLPHVAKSLLVNSIQRHGLAGLGGTCAFVSETDGKIDGVICGVLDLVYHVFDKLSAGDMVLHVAPDGSAKSAGELLDAYFEWAEGIEGVIEIINGASDIVQDYERASVLFRRKGMTQIGVIYERRTDT